MECSYQTKEAKKSEPHRKLNVKMSGRLVILYFSAETADTRKYVLLLDSNLLPNNWRTDILWNYFVPFKLFIIKDNKVVILM